MTRRGATLALTLSLALFTAAGMSGVLIEEGHFSWEVQP